MEGWTWAATWSRRAAGGGQWNGTSGLLAGVVRTVRYMQRAKAPGYVVPLTLAIIVVLLYLNFRNFSQVAILMGTLPLALMGNVWLMYFMDYSFSIAVGVGADRPGPGVAVKPGSSCWSTLDQAWRQLGGEVGVTTAARLARRCCRSRPAGAPVLMTAVATIVGLLPILYGAGTGSEGDEPPGGTMVGGMIRRGAADPAGVAGDLPAGRRWQLHRATVMAALPSGQ